MAIMSFGVNSKNAVALWTTKPNVPLLQVPHPSSRDAKALLDAWRDAVTQLRTIVTKDPDGDAAGPNYGTKFLESDYAPIPRGDLPFGVPPFLGDDSKGRTGHPKQNDSVGRPSPDDGHTLIWTAPRTGP